MSDLHMFVGGVCVGVFIALVWLFVMIHDDTCNCSDCRTAPRRRTR